MGGGRTQLNLSVDKWSGQADCGRNAEPQVVVKGIFNTLFKNASSKEWRK
jgi:hypothetical protein